LAHSFCHPDAEVARRGRRRAIVGVYLRDPRSRDYATLLEWVSPEVNF
jgi:hypothetical protein